MGQPLAQDDARPVLRKAQRLAASLDIDALLDETAHLAVPEMADWCVVDLLTERGGLRRVIAAHFDPQREEWARRMMEENPPSYGRGPSAAAARGKSQLISHHTREMIDTGVDDPKYRALLHQLHLCSMLSVPLKARDEIIGVMTFATAESGRTLNEADLAIAEELGAWAGLAIENALLYARQAVAQREAERLLAEREATLLRMAEGVVISGRDGDVVFMNDAAREMYGEDFVGRQIRDFPRALDIAGQKGEPLTAADNPLVRALDHGESVERAEVRVRRPSGGAAYLQRSARPVQGADGEILGAVMTIRDVTLERQAEHERVEFLSAAAHDLRTPLTVIRGMSQLVLRQLDEGRMSPQLLDHLRTIDQQAVRMTDLVSELLAVSQMDAGHKPDLHLSRCDLVQVVAEIVANQEAAGGHRFLREFPQGPVTGQWDVRAISRAIGNIVSNAVRYSPERDTIRIRVDRSANGMEVVVTVQDHGIGIPGEDQPRIFDRFYRGSNASHVSSGTGIGLTSARHMAELHGGSIGVTSQQDEGTTVELHLPLSSEPGEESLP